MAMISLLLSYFIAIELPLAILNFFAGIVGGIWLLALGKWSLFYWGLGITFFGSFLASFLLMPGILLSYYGSKIFDHFSVILGSLIIFLGSIWSYAIIVIWQLVIFFFFLSNANTPSEIIPIWLWTWGAATGVWSYFALKEKQADNDNNSAIWVALSTQVSFLVFSFCELWLQIRTEDSIFYMLIPVCIPMVIGAFTLLWRFFSSNKRSSSNHNALSKELIISSNLEEKPLHTQIINKTNEPSDIELIKKYEQAMKEKRIREGVILIDNNKTSKLD